jgi:pimeloyl-ACP methyl ester carboxylesterase
MRYSEPGAPSAPPSKRRSLGFFGSYLRHYDPLTMRAVWQGVFRGHPPVDAGRLVEIRVPVLAVAGMRDALYPGAKELAEQIPGARFVGLSERGHLAAIADPRFKQAVLEFFAAPQRVAGGGVGVTESE